MSWQIGLKSGRTTTVHRRLPEAGAPVALPHEVAGDEQHHHEPDQTRDTVHETAEEG
jgi:hypothetical protein